MNLSPSRKRISKGLAATGLGPIATTAIQLISVPVLLHAWGATRYGEWLILSAVPTYLSLSDLGFGDASGTDMTVNVAKGKRNEALETFQTSWALLNVISLAVFTLTCIATWAAPWQIWLSLRSLQPTEGRVALILLAAYALLGQQNSIFESGYRCDGNFASGTFWWTVQRVAETTAVTVVAALGGGFVWAAASLLIAKIAGVALYAAILFKKSPWLYLGLDHLRPALVRKLIRPAIGFVVVPLSQAVSIQGYILLVGKLEGPVLVAAFSTCRTLSRVNTQIVACVAKTVWPELSMAFAMGEMAAARKLHRYAFQATLLIALTGGALTWAAGPTVYGLWIRGEVPLDLTCLHILILVAVANSVWNTSFIVPMSTNAHHSLSWVLLAISCFSLVIGLGLTPAFGISGTAIPLLLGEMIACWTVLRVAMRQLGDTPQNLLRYENQRISPAAEIRAGEAVG